MPHRRRRAGSGGGARPLADAVRAAGADALVVHARKAWLKGLAPKENRDVPPLDYGRVYRLKRRFPGLPVAINGGIDARPGRRLAPQRLARRRRRHARPRRLSGSGDPARRRSRAFGEPAPVADALEAIEAIMPYIEARLAEGVRLSRRSRGNARPLRRPARRAAFRRTSRRGGEARRRNGPCCREAAGHVRRAEDRRAAA